MSPRLRRVLLSLPVVLLVLLGLAGTLDRQAARPVDAAFERALVTFAVVRGINAVVSVVQGTEVAVEPGGVGVVLTPGQVFDPVNDLIERFSWIMLAASTSLGAQKVLLEMGGAAPLQALLLLAGAALLVLVWRGGRLAPRSRGWLLRGAVLLLFVRFAVPLTVLLNEAVYEGFLAERYRDSQVALERTREQVEALEEAERPAPAAGDDGLLQRLGAWYDRTTRSLDIDARLALYQDRLARASEHVVRLIVVFVLETVVFPLLFLWAGLAALRALVRALR